MVKKIFFVLFIMLIGVIAFAFYGFQKQKLPQDVLKLEIIGPSEVEMLEDVEYTVIYKNKGEALLREVSLLFEHPDGAIPEEGKAKIVERKIGDLLPGQEKSSRFHFKLLGEEGETKTARAKISYKPKGLEAFFETSTTFTTSIKTVPVLFEFDLSSKVETGNLTFSVNYRSYSRDPLFNLNLKVEYPFGFEFAGSQPLGLTPDEWRIGLLNRGEGGRIDISGEMQGREFEQKIFKAELLMFNEAEQKTIVIKKISKGVEVVSPTIFVSQLINGKREYANPRRGSSLRDFFPEYIRYYSKRSSVSCGVGYKSS